MPRTPFEQAARHLLEQLGIVGRLALWKRIHRAIHGVCKFAHTAEKISDIPNKSVAQSERIVKDALQPKANTPEEN